MNTPRSWTEETGGTLVMLVPMHTGVVGICYWCGEDQHHRTSVFDRFSCNRLDVIHNDTSSMQADILADRTSASVGRQKP